MLREVCIIISNVKTGEDYQAKSYPDPDIDNDGIGELYKTPVYYVYIDGTSRLGNRERKTWRAVRFMPYWNDPAAPSTNYRYRGFANSGLHEVKKKVVTSYNKYYGVRNTYSPYGGAIQIRNSFLIHAGPRNLRERGWGAAGCVEIIGNFNDFKKDIHIFSGSTAINSDDAILELVEKGMLFVQVDKATPPNFIGNVINTYLLR